MYNLAECFIVFYRQASNKIEYILGAEDVGSMKVWLSAIRLCIGQNVTSTRRQDSHDQHSLQ